MAHDSPAAVCVGWASQELTVCPLSVGNQFLSKLDTSCKALMSIGAVKDVEIGDSCVFPLPQARRIAFSHRDGMIAKSNHGRYSGRYR